jgi:hypothetical protein
VTIRWIPASEENKLLNIAKEQARKASQEGATPQTRSPRVRSTTFNIARFKRGNSGHLPENVGRHSKRVDAALPGKHTRQLHDRLSWKEASVLPQLRTGIARLNAYLHRIRVAPLEQRVYGQARETVEHFLFQCRKWTPYRTEMLQCTDTYRSNISFYLGGKPPSDNRDWTPNPQAVRATVWFAMPRADSTRTNSRPTGTPKRPSTTPHRPPTHHLDSRHRFNYRG